MIIKVFSMSNINWYRVNNQAHVVTHVALLCLNIN